MTIIHTGNTTTTGFSVTSDATGNLVVKTGGSGGTTALTVGADQRVSFAQPPLTAVPAFRAYLSAPQSISQSTVTKVAIDSVTGDNFYDTHSWFDTSNNRYTPQIAGYYAFTGTIRPIGGNQSLLACYFFKNDSQYTTSVTSRPPANSGNFTFNFSVTAYMNGSTDYMDIRGFNNGTSPSFDYVNDAVTCFFEGFLVRAT